MSKEPHSLCSFREWNNWQRAQCYSLVWNHALEFTQNKYFYCAASSFSSFPHPPPHCSPHSIFWANKITKNAEPKRNCLWFGVKQKKRAPQNYTKMKTSSLQQGKFWRIHSTIPRSVPGSKGGLGQSYSTGAWFYYQTFRNDPDPKFSLHAVNFLVPQGKGTREWRGMHLRWEQWCRCNFLLEARLAGR